MPNFSKHKLFEYRLFSYPLPDVRNTTYQKLGLDPTATMDEVRRAKSEAVSRLKERKAEIEKRVEASSSAASEQTQLQESINDLDRQIKEINALNLENIEARSKYDELTPPCALLKLENSQEEVFTDRGRRTALFLLREEIAKFLEQQGEECYHPSDLTRTNFQSDFTYNPLLDE